MRDRLIHSPFSHTPLFRGSLQRSAIRSSIILAAVFALLIGVAVGLPGQANAASEDTPIYPGSERVDSASDEAPPCKDCEKVEAVNPAAALSSGGPDEFGYSFKDSNEVGGPDFDYVDISATGYELYLYDDSVAGPYSIGFEFEFYGETKHEFYIGSNGLIGFSSIGLWDYSNRCPIVDEYSPNDVIAILWDDLYPSWYGDIFYESFEQCPYDNGSACLVVQYSNIEHFGGGSAGEFEAILFDTGDVLLQYASAGDETGAYSTTGIENAIGTDGLTFACDEPNSLSGELAIRFSTENLEVAKDVDTALPEPGMPVTYTIMLNNSFETSLDNIVLDDLFPPDVTIAGPVTMAPAHPEATLAQDAADLPRLVAGLTLESSESVTVTVPATLSAGISGLRINQAIGDSPALAEAVLDDAAFYVLPDCETIEANPFENCSFETGTFTNWITSDITTPLLALQVGGAGVDTRYGQFVSDPIRGEYAALSGFDGSGPEVIKIAQDVALPVDATTLEFAYRIGYDLASYTGYESRLFVVEVEPEGGGAYPLQRTVVHVAESGNIRADSGDLLGQVDISEYAGTSVRIIFRLEVPEVNSGPAMFQLDNIMVNRVGPPQFANSPIVEAGTGLEYRHLAVITDSDIGDEISLSMEASSGSEDGWLSFEDYGNGTGMLSGWPSLNHLGETAVTIVAANGHGLTSQQSFNITVVEGPSQWRYGTFVPIYVSAPLE